MDNPKQFWSNIKQLKKDEPGVGGFKIDDKIISDGELKSEILKKQFSKHFTDKDLNGILVVGEDPKPLSGKIKMLNAHNILIVPDLTM